MGYFERLSWIHDNLLQAIMVVYLVANVSCKRWKPYVSILEMETEMGNGKLKGTPFVIEYAASKPFFIRDAVRLA